MKVFSKTAALRAELANYRFQKKSIVLVPTMGNLHKGHLQLIELAKSKGDIVVASIFVNKMQFGLSEKWELYPRTLAADIAKLEAVACNYLFAPEHSEMYPNGVSEQTKVFEPTMSGILCGASRKGHFQGVTTVINKLLNILQPTAMVLGLKDFQQLQIVKKMLEDICSQVQILAAPIAREDDGLAYSSRNVFLTNVERLKAAVLYEMLVVAKRKILDNKANFRQIEQHCIAIIHQQGFKIDYFCICKQHNLQQATSLDSDLVVVAAMYAKKTRLIDNIKIN